MWSTREISGEGVGGGRERRGLGRRDRIGASSWKWRIDGRLEDAPGGLWCSWILMSGKDWGLRTRRHLENSDGYGGTQRNCLNTETLLRCFIYTEHLPAVIEMLTLVAIVVRMPSPSICGAWALNFRAWQPCPKAWVIGGLSPTVHSLFGPWDCWRAWKGSSDGRALGSRWSLGHGGTRVLTDG
jgi:hypothetical protein